MEWKEGSLGHVTNSKHKEKYSICMACSQTYPNKTPLKLHLHIT